MSADEDAAQLVCVPPYHIAGIASLASSVYSGRRIVLLPSFTPEAWLERIADLKKQGREREAQESLVEFRKRYPDYKIPEALTR